MRRTVEIVTCDGLCGTEAQCDAVREAAGLQRRLPEGWSTFHAKTVTQTSINEKTYELCQTCTEFVLTKLFAKERIDALLARNT